MSGTRHCLANTNRRNEEREGKRESERERERERDGAFTLIFLFKYNEEPNICMLPLEKVSFKEQITASTPRYTGGSFMSSRSFFLILDAFKNLEKFPCF